MTAFLPVFLIESHLARVMLRNPTHANARLSSGFRKRSEPPNLSAERLSRCCGTFRPAKRLCFRYIGLLANILVSVPSLSAYSICNPAQLAAMHNSPTVTFW